MTPILIAALVGAVSGAATAPLWKRLLGRGVPEAKGPLIHIRGTVPGFYDRYCSGPPNWMGKSHCDHRAEYLDESARYWCAKHFPTDAKALERAVAHTQSGHADGECKAHGVDCPKPWGTWA